MVECVVRRQVSGAGQVMRIVMIILTVLIGIVGVVTLVLLPAFILAIVLTVSFCCKLHVEYEYSYANGILTIDRITNGKKRNQCLEIDLECARRICPYGQNGDPDFAKASVQIEDYASGRPDAAVHMILFESAGKQHKVIFEPDVKMLSAMRQTVPEIMY